MINGIHSCILHRTRLILPVTDIAMASGFNSWPYFIRCFKSKYGLSPNAGRRVL
ncbi:AraC family transcriptional regulator [Paenibacillus alba]|uniref:AraC family transcriptional regulator n=1 Tax=Paenibacillus alba TaxID=1197127 RepID=UPI003B847818|nr:AraC family transcriptional regulator [Paenibacillus alba]